MGVSLWPFRPLCERSRRPLVAPLTRQTRCGIASYSTKAEMTEVGSYHGREFSLRRKKYMRIMPRNGATSPSQLHRGAPPRCLAPVVGTKGGGLVAILNLT